MKESFIFYLSHYEAVKDLNDEQLGRLFRALFEKQLGNKVLLDNDIKIAFNFINNQMVLDKTKYENRCKVNKINGKKGGRPRKNIDELKTEKPNGYFQNPNDNDNDNDNENDNDNYNDNDITTSSNNIFTFIESNFSRTLSPIEYEQISLWEDNELTRYAIKQAVLKGKYNIKYIDSILNNYHKNNIRTVIQAKSDEEEFKNKLDENKKYQAMSFQQREYERQQKLLWGDDKE